MGSKRAAPARSVVPTNHALNTAYDGVGLALMKMDPSVAGASFAAARSSAAPRTPTTRRERAHPRHQLSERHQKKATSPANHIRQRRRATAMTDGTGTAGCRLAAPDDELHQRQRGDRDLRIHYGSADLRSQESGQEHRLPQQRGTVSQAWNATGRLAVSDWNSKTTTFGYDANSQRDDSDGAEHDARDRHVRVQRRGPDDSVSDRNGSTLFSATYTRDSAGQLASATFAGDQPGGSTSTRRSTSSATPLLRRSKACSSPRPIATPMHLTAPTT